jgi:S-DNA-T family DNA segregation ATPase FtsK/SpoIIIE
VARRHGELFAAILQEGRRVGVHVTATSPRRTGIAAAALTAFGARLVLRMTAPDDYLMLGVPGDVLDADSPPGRGLLGRAEVQLATLGGAGTAAQAQRLVTLAEKVAGRVWPRPQVPSMPSRVPHHAVPDAVGDALAIGVDAEYATSLTVPLTEAPVLVAGRARTGRSALLAGLAAQARRSTVPPVQTVLIGPNAGQMTEPDRYDVVLDDPQGLRGWLADATLDPADGWRLLLVDDAHLWERGWESDPAVRDAMGGLAALVDQAPGRRLAVVVAADADEARSRSHIPGVVQAARRGRRGVLLVPDYADGSLFGVTIPSHTVEPLVGTGRGLWCSGATVRVVQTVGTPAPDGEAT